LKDTSSGYQFTICAYAAVFPLAGELARLNDVWSEADGPHASARYPVEIGCFRRLRRLDGPESSDANHFLENSYVNDLGVRRTSKIGKLNFVAGAEIPRRYLS
jgi:hypothetical protein